VEKFFTGILINTELGIEIDHNLVVATSTTIEVHHNVIRGGANTGYAVFGDRTNSGCTYSIQNGWASPVKAPWDGLR